MVKTVICSVGTSAAKAVCKPSDLLNWVNQQESVEDAAKQVFFTFRDIVPEGESLKNKLSAEIHSLVRIGITNQDKIILLASSTDDGYCCALAVQKYLEHHWDRIKVEVKKVKGLQVLDASLFRTTGVVEFVRCFDNVRQLDDCDPFRFLSRVATSKEAFQLSEHINVGNGLRWLKPGRTTDRYLVSIEGWRMLVWRAIREDQEGERYANTVQVNPNTERRAYSPFMRMEFVD